MISYALDRGEITPRLVLQTIIPHKGRRLYFYRLDAHHGLLAPEVVGGTARGAAEGGGRVIAVVASAIPAKPNRWVQQEIVVEIWEDRLHKLIALGEGYVACRGGTGTLVELAVAWEMMNKGLLPRRPLVALGEFWRPVVELVRSAQEDPRGKP